MPPGYETLQNIFRSHVTPLPSHTEVVMGSTGCCTPQKCGEKFGCANRMARQAKPTKVWLLKLQLSTVCLYKPPPAGYWKRSEQPESDCSRIDLVRRQCIIVSCPAAPN
jgi:hypothetical protein